MMAKIKKHWLVICLILFSITPIIWFLGRGNVLINGVDTNFPLDPLNWFQKRFYVWTQVNGGADFSSSTAGLLFHLVQTIPFALGLKLQTIQVISLMFWFGTITFAAYSLAKELFSSNKYAQIVFVSIYVFNTYLFNTWENVKVSNIALVAGIPLISLVLIKLCRKKISYLNAFFYSLLVGLIASGSGINPSYMICLILSLVIVYIGLAVANFGVVNQLDYFKNFLIVASGLMLVNIFWILPTANHVLKTISSNQSISSIGYTNWIDSLSENTSPLSVMRLQGAWDWYVRDSATGTPLYIPYAIRYFNSLPFILFSLSLPSLSVLSLIAFNYIRQKKNSGMIISSAILIVVGVFFGVGTHSPTGKIFAWMAQYIPFFSLFRSPWYIFTPMVVLGYAVLIANIFIFLRTRVKVWLVSVFTAIFVVANLLYNYPLVTGKIFRPGRSDSFYTIFPDYVFETLSWLENKPQGRIIDYPDDQIVQFNWGYRGIESILQLGTSVETLFPPLNSSNDPLALLVDQFYYALKRKEFTTVIRIARKLNISYLFDKADQKSIAYHLPLDMPLEVGKSIGPWTFYSFSKYFEPQKVAMADKFFQSYPFNSIDKAMSLVPLDTHIVNPDDSVVNSAPAITNNIGKIVQGKTSISTIDMSQDVTKVVYYFTIPSDGNYIITLENYGLSDFGLPTSGEISLAIDGKETSVKINHSDDYLYLEKTHFSAGDHKLALSLGGRNSVNFSGSVVVASDDSSGGLKSYQINGFDPLSKYLVRVENMPRGLATGGVTAAQYGNTGLKSVGSSVPKYPGWNQIGVYFIPIESDSNALVRLSAFPSAESPHEVIEYRNLEAIKVFTNKLFLIKEPGKSDLTTPNISYSEVSPVKYRGHVAAANGSYVISFLENYSKEWELKIPSGIVKHFTIDGYANAWYIEGAPADYDFEIYYKPQTIYIAGLFVSAGLMGVTGILVIVKRFMRK